MTFRDLSDADHAKVIEALKFFGFPVCSIIWIDICESGQVFSGLTEILPRGSVSYVTR